jgi:sugar/nucleoside kinase (ribokinase family)
MNSVQSARVGCAGILVEDTFCGPFPEMPQEGRLVSVNAMPQKAGGCAANVAIDLVKQGVSVDLAGCVGIDSAAEGLFKSFDEFGIGRQGVLASKELPTSQTVILLVEGQDRRYIHLFGANAGFAATSISRDWLKSLSVFYLGGLFALPGMKCKELLDVFAFCQKHGVKTVLDVVVPHGTPASGLSEYAALLEVTDYFLPNDDEATILTGYRGVKDQLAKFLSLGAGTVIITRGQDGAVAARGNDYWECGSYKMDCIDPSGAGDAFTSGVIASILAGRDMPGLLQYASAIGASATQKVGTTDGIISRAKAEAFIAQHPLIIEQHALDQLSTSTPTALTNS